MKQSTKLSLLALITGSSLALAKETKLKSDKEKASYAIGQQIGDNMRNQGVEIDVNVLAESITEALAGKKSRLTEEESHKAMQVLQEKVRARQADMAKQNKDKGEKYLAENGKKTGVVTTTSGLQYEVTKEGKGEIPKDGAKVKVHYEGTLLDGKEFDSSYKRKTPAEFGVNEVIPGWTEALKLMKVGSVWNLTIPSRLAYGEHGQGPIPANSVLKFKVELLEVLPTPPPAPAAAAPTADKGKTTK
jgi:FKBP-type peptidyl-prolyl cis-trans isomerase